MQSLHVDDQETDVTCSKSRALAKRLARDNRMQDPPIISWHPRSSDVMSPSCAGASPDSWWEKHDEGNGGRLEISAGGEFDCVMMESHGYETVGQLPIRNLADSQGQEYVCFTSMPGNPLHRITRPVCRWMSG